MSARARQFPRVRQCAPRLAHTAGAVSSDHSSSPAGGAPPWGRGRCGIRTTSVILLTDAVCAVLQCPQGMPELLFRTALPKLGGRLAWSACVACAPWRQVSVLTSSSPSLCEIAHGCSRLQLLQRASVQVSHRTHAVDAP
jgi:hypothetical protein